MVNDEVILPEDWEEWEVLEKIGKGSYGSVYRVRKKTDEGELHAAVKIINIPSGEKELNRLRRKCTNEQEVVDCIQELQKSFKEELEWLSSLKDNPNIVTIEDFKVKKDIGYQIYVRMEELRSLHSYNEEFTEIPEKEAVKLGIDICNALISFEEHQMIHCSIKPSNIFRSGQGDYKIGDFDVAERAFREEESDACKETLVYMAPELINGDSYTENVDIYSLGLVLYQIMNGGKLPFEDIKERKISEEDRWTALNKRANGNGFKRPVNASDDFADVIMKACSFNPSLRYQSAYEMKEDLSKLKSSCEIAAVPSEPVSETSPKEGGRIAAITIGAILLFAVGVFASYEFTDDLPADTVEKTTEGYETEKGEEFPDETETEKTKYTVVSNGNLNVRKDPDSGSDIVGKLASGDVVIGSGEESGNWIQVDFTDEEGQDQTGWVFKSYLNELSDEPSGGQSESTATENWIFYEQAVSDTAQEAQHKVCSNCGGSGAVMVSGGTVCSICGGSGMQYIPNAYYDAVIGWQGTYVGCGGCGGSGYINSPTYAICSVCGGAGYIG